MVPRRAGGNPSSLIPEEKRVLSRVARGIYALQTGEGSKLVVKAPPANLSVSSSILDCFVVGSPSPFANPGERGFISTSKCHEWVNPNAKVLYFGDHDPSGLCMDESIKGSIFTDFKDFNRVALTDQGHGLQAFWNLYQGGQRGWWWRLEVAGGPGGPRAAGGLR